MEGYWPIFFLLVVLKVPAVGMIWLLFWAARNESENGLVDESEGGGGRRRPQPPLPRGPRRGPHGDGTIKQIPRRSELRVRPGGRQAEPTRVREREPARSRERERSV